MRIEVCLYKGAAPELVAALNNPELRNRLRDDVLTHLGAQNFGPAAFYVQECGFSSSSKPMCDVRLTGVSATESRTGDKFRAARDALEDVYRELIDTHHTSDFYLMVSIAADSVPSGLSSPLIERGGEDSSLLIKSSKYPV